MFHEIGAYGPTKTWLFLYKNNWVHINFLTGPDQFCCTVNVPMDPTIWLELSTDSLVITPSLIHINLTELNMATKKKRNYWYIN